jgi:hypothetical protein
MAKTAVKEESESDYSSGGVVEVLSSRQCGFCMVGNHTGCCIKTSPFWGKSWVCPCECDKSLVVKRKVDLSWVDKYRGPFKDPDTKKPKSTTTNISSAPSTATKITRVPAKPRDKRVDALATEMLEDVRKSDDYQKEKEKWES